ncbi:MAG TPA: SDR family NAD(P)-dependent oxidoreductase [Puia sp.]
MSWALVTGGSKGIGFSIAESLAKREYNIVLVARNQIELLIAKSKLEKNFNIEVEIISCDLSISESAKIISDWCNSRGFELKILCNAAGMGGSKDFFDLPLNDLRTMIRVNLESTIALCSTLIPQLKINAPSYILNIGSLAGFAPIPLKNVYASTKSALHSFSYSLRYLLKNDKISVSCLCPGPVFTKPSIEKETIKQLGWFGKQMAVETSVVGELAVQAMLRHKIIIVPGKLATIVSYLLRIIPGQFLAYIFYSFRKQNINNPPLAK